MEGEMSICGNLHVKSQNMRFNFTSFQLLNLYKQTSVSLVFSYHIL